MTSTHKARERVANATRRLGAALMEYEATPERLERLARVLDEEAIDLEKGETRERDIARLKGQMFPEHVEAEASLVHFDECLVSGRYNPFGVGMRAYREGDGVTARVTLTQPYEGPPGRAHGGVVAALLDDVTGYLLTLLGTPGFTGQLTIRYLAPTPLSVELVLRSWVVHVDGRRILTEAEMVAGDAKVAVASGMLIAVSPPSFSSGRTEVHSE